MVPCAGRPPTHPPTHTHTHTRTCTRTRTHPSPTHRHARWPGCMRPDPPPYTHPCVQVNSLLFGAVAFITPVRYFLPVQFAMLLLNLYATMHRCAVECGVAPPPAHAVAAWVGECGGDVLPGAASAACPAAVADTEGASAYYKAVVTWIRRLLPLSGSLRMRARALLPLWSRRPGSCCLGSCWAVHGWLQVRRIGRGGPGAQRAMTHAAAQTARSTSGRCATAPPPLCLTPTPPPCCFSSLSCRRATARPPPPRHQQPPRLLSYACRRWAACCCRWPCCGCRRSG